jgi:protease I
MSEQPATNAGNTSAAGEGVDDSTLAEQVADQTDSNLEVEETFERESGGAASDTEAAKASGDELT